MAQVTTFSPEIMAALTRKAAYVEKAKDSTNPFESFAGPKGRYYARLRRFTVSLDTKTSNPKFNFLHTCLATVPDASSSSAVPDQKWAGKAMRNSAMTNASDNQTEAEAWERAMQTLQAYDVKTQMIGMRDGKFSQEHMALDLLAVANHLNESLPAVIIDVTESEGKGKNAGKMFKNCNPRSTVPDEVVAQFASPTMEVDDSDMPELPDDGVEETPTVEQALEIIAANPEEAIRASLADDEASKHLDIAAMTSEQVKELAICIITKAPLPEWANSQTNSTPASTLEVSADPAAPVTTQTDQVALTEIPDDDEEVAPADDDEEEASAPAEDPTLKVQLYVGTLDRANLKKLIRSRGGRKPEQKFVQTETDEALRDELAGLILGTITPVHVVVPDECPF